MVHISGAMNNGLCQSVYFCISTHNQESYYSNVRFPWKGWEWVGREERGGKEGNDWEES